MNQRRKKTRYESFKARGYRRINLEIPEDIYVAIKMGAEQSHCNMNEYCKRGIALIIERDVIDITSADRDRILKKPNYRVI